MVGILRPRDYLRLLSSKGEEKGQTLLGYLGIDDNHYQKDK